MPKQATAVGRGHSREGGVLRGPNSLGNLVTPGSTGRDLGWRLSVRTIRRVRSPKKTSRISGGRSAGIWMSSLKMGSPTGWLIPIGLKGGYYGLPRRRTKDWLAARVPTLVACVDCRLTSVGLDALRTYKRVVDCFRAMRRTLSGISCGFAG